MPLNVACDGVHAGVQRTARRHDAGSSWFSMFTRRHGACS